ncbi:MAG TPA: hypothetical protein IGS31_12405 [Oscillatoriales cyanobacterium M4454_W2019_049]|nr:hypothetical protein [Oscillatoriales cyanobacterium M4454_W2019_049]
MTRNLDDSPRLYFHETLQKWLIEDYDGNVREPSPEEMDAFLNRWEQQAEAGDRQAREWDDPES